MNKNMMIAAVVIVVVVGIGGYFFFMRSKGSSTVQPEVGVMEKTVPTTGSSVEIKDFAFGPKTLTVKVGTIVTFTNRDIAAHTATADDGSFDTRLLKKDQSGTVTFDTVGTFTYHCTAHPSMKATIVVEK